MAQARYTGRVRGMIEGGMQHADLDKIIEVTGPKCGILAVIGETEQLLGSLGIEDWSAQMVERLRKE